MHLILTTSLIFCFALGVQASAQNTTKVEPQKERSTLAPNKFDVQWYRPEALASKKQKRTRVLLSGKTLPDAKIGFPNNNLAAIVNGRVRYLPLKKALIGERVVRSDENGIFKLELELPAPYKYQVPVLIVSPESNQAQRRFQLNLSVAEKEVASLDQKDLKRSPLLRKKYGIWMGTGFNYLLYEQSSDIPSGIKFQTFKGPSFYLSGQARLTEKWAILSSAKMSPGSVSSSADITIAEGGYQWLIFALEGAYFPGNWNFTFRKKFDVHTGVRFGVQHHIVPFISRPANDKGTIETNGMTMATVGFHTMINELEDWAYEIFMRYQYPFQTGSVFTIKPRFAFDGSLGLSHRLTDSWRLGLYWYGQWHQYDFTAFDNPLNREISGSETLFFSNFEVRAGFKF